MLHLNNRNCILNWFSLVLIALLVLQSFMLTQITVEAPLATTPSCQDLEETSIPQVAQDKSSVTTINQSPLDEVDIWDITIPQSYTTFQGRKVSEIIEANSLFLQLFCSSEYVGVGTVESTIPMYGKTFANITIEELLKGSSLTTMLSVWHMRGYDTECWVSITYPVPHDASGNPLHDAVHLDSTPSLKTGMRILFFVHATQDENGSVQVSSVDYVEET